MTLDALAGVALDAAYTRYVGFNVECLKLTGLDAAYTAVAQLYIVGNTAYLDVTNTAVDNLQVVGIQAVHLDAGGTAIVDVNQVGGVNLNGYVAGMDIDTLLGVSDGKLAILALELIQFLVVIGGGKLDGAALLLVLYNLYMTYPAHVNLLEG